MTEGEAGAKAAEAYKRKYNQPNAVVQDVVRTANGGFLAVINPGNPEHEEICIIDKNGRVRLFDGTGDLMFNLATLNADRLSPFAPTVVAAVAFLITLIAVIAFTWTGEGNREGLQALTGILGLAAGFYFGNQTAKG